MLLRIVVLVLKRVTILQGATRLVDDSLTSDGREDQMSACWLAD
jgi:hypothetical protein